MDWWIHTPKGTPAENGWGCNLKLGTGTSNIEQTEIKAFFRLTPYDLPLRFFYEPLKPLERCK